MKKIALYFFSLVLIINFTFLYPVPTNALGFVGNAGLKQVVMGAWETAGIKFSSKKAKERAWDAWNLKAYEKWKADEAAGRNADLWAEFNAIKQTGVPKKHKVTEDGGVPNNLATTVLSSNIYGMAILIGAEIGYSIQDAQAYNRIQKYAMTEALSEYRDLQNFNSAVVTKYERVDSYYYPTTDWAHYWYLFGTDTIISELQSKKIDPDPALNMQIYKITEGSTYYEISYKTTRSSSYSGKVLTTDSNKRVSKVDVNKYFQSQTPRIYESVPKIIEVPRIDPDPELEQLLQPEVDLSQIGTIVPQWVPSEIIVPLDDSVWEGELNPRHDPEPIPGTDSGIEIDPNSPEPTEPNNPNCNESDENMEVNSGQCEGIPYFGLKLEFIFGNATGNKNHIDRSLAMEQKLNNIGIFDDAKGKKLVLDNLSNAFDNPSSIIKTQNNGQIVRGSVLTGPNGILKVESIWDKEKLITVKLSEDVEGGSAEEDTDEETEEIDETDETGWSMPRGGAVIEGRKYSEHALERMAPDTPAVRAELTTRAHEKATEKGLESGTEEYYEFVRKYVDPRGITPAVVEDVIKNTPVQPGKYEGTFMHQNEKVTVIINNNGDVITVIPR